MSCLDGPAPGGREEQTQTNCEPADLRPTGGAAGGGSGGLIHGGRSSSVVVNDGARPYRLRPVQWPPIWTLALPIFPFKANAETERLTRGGVAIVDLELAQDGRYVAVDGLHGQDEARGHPARHRGRTEIVQHRQGRLEMANIIALGERDGRLVREAECLPGCRRLRVTATGGGAG